MEKMCLFNKGSRCYILNKKECNKCKFFKENTEENRITYIDNIKKDIERYAQNKNQKGN